MTEPVLAQLTDRIREARAARTPLCLRGHGSKDFYGGAPAGELLSVGGLRGISSYEPTELVVTVRAGTPIVELEAVLAERGQCLAFEPPRFGGQGTVGGMIASGLAGPSRAAVGSVRDFVLGASVLNGRGELLAFGGQVMKNVAGYDVSRALVGAMGVLGLVCEVSLKVLPVAPATATLRFEMNEAKAIEQLNAWAGRPLPLNASAWWAGALLVRLAGAQAAVRAAAAEMGGEAIEAAAAAPFWRGLRDQRDEYFTGAAKAVEAGAALWRLSLPPTAPPLGLAGEQLIEWGGAQRWLVSEAPAAALREAAAKAGGHATLYRAKDKSAGVFAPLAPALARIHRELKAAFDPDGVFNPGRLYPDL